MEHPKDFLFRGVGRPVVVVLKDQRTVRGKLSGYDEFINLVLDEASEEGNPKERALGRVVVRGSQVIAVHLPRVPGAAG
jgi:small nuclear ribonucleoprotein (snRNP)-like protein